jgi:UDP-N-acetylmuramate dehydrogenase
VIGKRTLSGVERLTASLQAVLGAAAVEINQPLSRYTALRVGGPADLLVKAGSVEMLRQAVVLAREHGVPCCVLGGGSNVLVSDKGVRGLVVLNRARGVTFPRPASARGDEAVEVHQVRAESGASFSAVARQAVNRGLAGLEWAASIPGSVGGAIVGNAGAWGGDVASTLVQAAILDVDGTVTQWPVERFEYAYRTSILKHHASCTTPVVLDGNFALHQGRKAALRTRVAGMSARRRASQPPGATCGSVFKNPAGDYAGRLIESAGLKGTRRGGAEISPLHANFIVNLGGATASDVKALIDLARARVQAGFGMTLELEIELLGEW